jgi:hypothetical protein
MLMTESAAKSFRCIAALIALAAAFTVSAGRARQEDPTAQIEKSFREAVDLYDQESTPKPSASLKKSGQRPAQRSSRAWLMKPACASSQDDGRRAHGRRPTACGTSIANTT